MNFMKNIDRVVRLKFLLTPVHHLAFLQEMLFDVFLDFLKSIYDHVYIPSKYIL